MCGAFTAMLVADVRSDNITDSINAIKIAESKPPIPPRRWMVVSASCE